MITDELKMNAVRHYRDGHIADRKLSGMLYREDELSKYSRTNSIFYALKYKDGDRIREYHDYVGIYFDLEYAESGDNLVDVTFKNVEQTTIRYECDNFTEHRGENIDEIVAAFDVYMNEERE